MKLVIVKREMSGFTFIVDKNDVNHAQAIIDEIIKAYVLFVGPNILFRQVYYSNPYSLDVLAIYELPMLSKSKKRLKEGIYEVLFYEIAGKRSSYYSVLYKDCKYYTGESICERCPYIVECIRQKYKSCKLDIRQIPFMHKEKFMEFLDYYYRRYNSDDVLQNRKANLINAVIAKNNKVLSPLLIEQDEYAYIDKAYYKKYYKKLKKIKPDVLRKIVINTSIQTIAKTDKSYTKFILIKPYN